MNDDTDNEFAGDPRDEIARLETTVDELAEDLERSRKIDLAAKALAAGGAIWLLAGVVGIVAFGPMTLLGSIAATLGGLVLLGSNSSTMQQIKADLAAAEARRSELIGVLELRAVDADLAPQRSRRWLH